MKVGYARVSTVDQNLSLQIDALKIAGCQKIFTDKMSGAKRERPFFQEALKYLRDGEDSLVVWRLDRLGRSLKHLMEIVKELEERKIGLQVIQQSIDTTTSGGKLFFHIFGALAEFERDLIRERTHAGLQAARVRGRFGGRPKSLDDKQIKFAKKLHKEKELSINEICQMLGISRSTFYRYLS